MVDVKFEVKYEIGNGDTPTPLAHLAMNVKADAAGYIPVNVRCPDRILSERMGQFWGGSKENGWRARAIEIHGDTWPAVQELAEKEILDAVAKMEKANERHQKMVAEQPADYIYSASIPGPALPKKGCMGPWGEIPIPPDSPLYDASQIEEADEREREEKLPADVDNRLWVKAEFGLSDLPCASAANFLVNHFDDITRYAKGLYGGQWWNLTSGQRFDAGIAWMKSLIDADDETSYPLSDWIEWALNHWA